MTKKIGVLALQGCVEPHRFHIQSLGYQMVLVKNPSDLGSIDALILPGGESTTMPKLIAINQLEQPIVEFVKNKPVWGICAGAILLAKKVLNPEQHSLKLIDITIERNSYGRQIASFETVYQNYPVFFIRAPIIKNIDSSIEVLWEFDENPVLIRQNNILISTFHPELCQINVSPVHKFFVA